MGEQAEPERPTEIEFHFIKGNFFRVIHIDGAYGGVTPRAEIHMCVYNERGAIPTKTVHKVSKDGFGDEIRAQRKGKSGFIREMECDLVMTVSTAEALQAWLGEKIAHVKRLIEKGRPDDAG